MKSVKALYKRGEHCFFMVMFVYKAFILYRCKLMPHSCMKVGLDGLGQNTIPPTRGEVKGCRGRGGTVPPINEDHSSKITLWHVLICTTVY